MRLQLKTIPHIGNHAYVLCDNDGEPLPNQEKIVVEQAVDQLTKVTVTFHVDGRHIRIAESK